MIVNEAVGLVCSYAITQSNDKRYEPAAAYQIGELIRYTLYFCWASNALVVLKSILATTVQILRKCKIKKKCKFFHRWLKKRANTRVIRLKAREQQPETQDPMKPSVQMTVP